MKFKIAALAGALAVCATAAHAGGFWLDVRTPDAADPKMKDAVLVFHASGCHGPGASVAGTAEGIVDGKRKSIPLKFKAIGNDKFTVTRQWPRNGRWALAVTATGLPQTHNGKTYEIKSSAVVELTDSGTVMVSQPNGRRRAGVVTHRPDRETLAELVDKTLKSYPSRRAAL